MSRYIDADNLRHRVLYFADARNLNGNHEQAKAYNHCLCMIDEQKTADVVEVVRCRDCKYMCHYTDGHMECRLLADLKPIPTTYCTMNADDFCSYGERREAGNE